MRERASAPTSLPTKTQDMVVEIGGRPFSICSDGQMSLLRDSLRHKVMAEAMDRGEKLESEDEISKRVDVEVEASQWATVNMILVKLPQQERERWVAQYRFGGVWNQRRQ